MVHMDTVIEPIRRLVKSFMHRVAKDLDKLSGGRISPNMVTITGLMAHLPIAWLIATNEYVLAAILLVIFGLFDTLDGSLARLQKSQSDKGMLLDSLTDRVKEVMLYVGISYSFVSLGQPYWAIWAVVACGAAVTVSYINAWGEALTKNKPKNDHAKNSSFRNGIMSFDIRIFLLVIGLTFNLLPVVIVTIALGSGITIIQRFQNINTRL